MLDKGETKTGNVKDQGESGKTATTFVSQICVEVEIHF